MLLGCHRTCEQGQAGWPWGHYVLRRRTPARAVFSEKWVVLPNRSSPVSKVRVREPPPFSASLMVPGRLSCSWALYLFPSGPAVSSASLSPVPCSLYGYPTPLVSFELGSLVSPSVRPESSPLLWSCSRSAYFIPSHVTSDGSVRLLQDGVQLCLLRLCPRGPHATCPSIVTAAARLMVLSVRHRDTLHTLCLILTITL